MDQITRFNLVQKTKMCLLGPFFNDSISQSIEYAYFFLRFIYLFDREKEREISQAEGVAEGEACPYLSRKPDVGLMT